MENRYVEIAIAMKSFCIRQGDGCISCKIRKTCDQLYRHTSLEDADTLELAEMLEKGVIRYEQ